MTFHLCWHSMMNNNDYSAAQDSSQMDTKLQFFNLFYHTDIVYVHIYQTIGTRKSFNICISKQLQPKSNIPKKIRKNLAKANYTARLIADAWGGKNQSGTIRFINQSNGSIFTAIAMGNQHLRKSQLVFVLL